MRSLIRHSKHSRSPWNSRKRFLKRRCRRNSNVHFATTCKSWACLTSPWPMIKWTWVSTLQLLTTVLPRIALKRALYQHILLLLPINNNTREATVKLLLTILIKSFKILWMTMAAIRSKARLCSWMGSLCNSLTTKGRMSTTVASLRWYWKTLLSMSKRSPHRNNNNNSLTPWITSCSLCRKAWARYYLLPRHSKSKIRAATMGRVVECWVIRHRRSIKGVGMCLR